MSVRPFFRCLVVVFWCDFMLRWSVEPTPRRSLVGDGPRARSPGRSRTVRGWPASRKPVALGLRYLFVHPGRVVTIRDRSIVINWSPLTVFLRRQFLFTSADTFVRSLIGRSINGVGGWKLYDCVPKELSIHFCRHFLTCLTGRSIVGVGGWKLYDRVPETALPIHLFRHFCNVLSGTVPSSLSGRLNNGLAGLTVALILRAPASCRDVTDPLVLHCV